jgi:hypothetical protein
VRQLNISAETISGNSKLQSSSEGEQFSIGLDNLHQIHTLDVEVMNSNPVVPDMVSTKFSLVTSSKVYMNKISEPEHASF